MSDDLEPVVIDGVERRMGRTLPTDDHLKMRAGMTSFRDFMSSKGVNIDTQFPRSSWKPIDRRKIFGQEVILDQGQIGACVGFSAACSLMGERAIRGQKVERLSGYYIYDQINHGVDRGACITDSMGVLISKGTCLETEYQKPRFNTQIQPESIAKYGLEDGGAFTCTSFFEMAVAIQMGGFPQYPVMVTQNYGNFSPDGVCGFCKGPGNHSVCAWGMIQLSNGLWVFQHPGTWGPTWGPWHDGWAYHSEQAVTGCAMQDDSYVKMSVRFSPEDAPPKLVA